MKQRVEALKVAMPPLKGPSSENGVVLAPIGSLVIPGRSAWVGSEYLILGQFTASSL